MMCVIFFSVDRQVFYEISKDFVGIVIIVLEKKDLKVTKFRLIHESKVEDK